MYLFIWRYFYSTNYKDIGTLYFIFGTFSGILGTILNVLIRLELAFPGNTFFSGDHQLYNVVVTAHALLIIFFMVMPILIGNFGSWFVSLFVGAPSSAFRRLNNINFRLFILINVLFIAILILLVNMFDFIEKVNENISSLKLMEFSNIWYFYSAFFFTIKNKKENIQKINFFLNVWYKNELFNFEKENKIKIWWDLYNFRKIKWFLFTIACLYTFIVFTNLQIAFLLMLLLQITRFFFILWLCFSVIYKTSLELLNAYFFYKKFSFKIQNRVLWPADPNNFTNPTWYPLYAKGYAAGKFLITGMPKAASLCVGALCLGLWVIDPVCEKMGLKQPAGALLEKTKPFVRKNFPTSWQNYSQKK